MPLIEGIGDEVTIFFGILFFVGILSLAWFSTHIRDIPFFSLIIIELTHRRRRQSASVTQSQNETSSQGVGSVAPSPSNVESTSENDNAGISEGNDSIPESSSDDTARRETNVRVNESICDSSLNQSEVDVNKDDGVVRTESNGDSGTNQQEVDGVPIIPQTESLSETELRRRRVAFFENKSVDNNSENESESSENICVSEKQSSVAQEFKSVTLSASLEKCVQSPPERVKGNNESVDPSLSSEHSSSEGHVTSSEQSNETPTQSTVNNDESQIRIRLKYLNDSQRQVTALPTQTIGQFRRDNFASELENNKLVRFIFNGQDLRNDSNTLQAYNIVDNSVVHCLITQIDRQANQQRNQDADDGFDVGNLMLPIFGFIICVVWYLRFEYRQFFSGTSTVSLIGITFLYIAAILASWEHRRRGHVHEHVD